MSKLLSFFKQKPFGTEDIINPKDPFSGGSGDFTFDLMPSPDLPKINPLGMDMSNLNFNPSDPFRLNNIQAPDITRTPLSLFSSSGPVKRPSRAEALLGKVGSVGENLAKAAEVGIPFVTYMQNQNLINNTPEVPAPVLVDDVKYNTDINVEPMIREVNESARAARRSASANLVDPTQAASVAFSTQAGAQREINKIRADEYNKESQLENMQQRDNLFQSNQRTQQVDQFQTEQMERELDIQGKKSQNMNLLQDTLQTVIRDRKLDRADRLKFVMMARALNTDGVISRNLLPFIQEFDPQMAKDMEANGYFE